MNRDLLRGVIVNLSDGSTAKAYSRRDPNNINCHRCYTFVNERCLEAHLKGKRHEKRLKQELNAGKFRQQIAKLEAENLMYPLEDVKVKLEDSEDIAEDWESKGKARKSIKSSSKSSTNINFLNSLNPTRASNANESQPQESLYIKFDSFQQLCDFHQKSHQPVESSANMNLKPVRPDKKTLDKYCAAEYKLTAEIKQDRKSKHKRPESHPAYQVEWKKFWARRSKEVLNPQTHDFKKEWIPFWTSRLDEIYTEELEIKKKELRESFGLSSDVAFIEEHKAKWAKSRSPEGGKIKRSRRPRSTSRDHSKRQRTSFDGYEVVSSSDDSELNKCSSNSSYRSSNNDKAKDTGNLQSRDPRLNRSADRKPVSMITVSRLLAALEVELGMHANKALDLLAATIEEYQKNPDTAEQELMTKEHSMLLRVIREKMKGLLMVEIYSTQKTNAIETLIEDITQLIAQTPVKVVQNPPSDSKTKVAKEMSKLLETHLKINVSVADLVTLIDVLVDNQNKSTQAQSIEDIRRLTDEQLTILLDRIDELELNDRQLVEEFVKTLEKTDPSRVQMLRTNVIMKGSEGKSDVVMTEVQTNNKLIQIHSVELIDEIESIVFSNEIDRNEEITSSNGVSKDHAVVCINVDSNNVADNGKKTRNGTTAINSDDGIIEIESDDDYNLNEVVSKVVSQIDCVEDIPLIVTPQTSSSDQYTIPLILPGRAQKRQGDFKNCKRLERMFP